MTEPQNSVPVPNEACEVLSLLGCTKDKLKSTTKKIPELAPKAIVKDLPIRTSRTPSQLRRSYAGPARRPPVSKDLEIARLHRSAENQILRAEGVLRVRAALKRDKAKMSSEPEESDLSNRTSQCISELSSASSTSSSSPSVPDQQYLDMAPETHTPDHDFDETHDILRNKIDNQEFMINVIEQMMFVSGETAEPSIETTTLIEDITRQQVLEIVSFCSTRTFTLN